MTQEIKSNENEGNPKSNAEEINEVNNDVSSTAENSITKAYSNDVVEAKVTDEKIIENTAAVETTDSAFTIIRHDNGIAHLVIDVIGENVNTLKAEFTEQVNAVLAEIKADNETKLLLYLDKANEYFLYSNNCLFLLLPLLMAHV